jgi:hypothetical protein
MLIDRQTSRARGPFVIAIAVVALVAASALALAGRNGTDGSSPVGGQAPAPAAIADAAPGDAGTGMPSRRVERALSWVHGLANGLILPSDVTARLGHQDPGLARIVLKTWWDLHSYGYGIR